MAVKFKVYESELKLGNQNQKLKFARVVQGERVNLEELSHLIGRISAMSSGDVMSVLHTTADLVAMNLSNGRPVSLGDLGALRLTIHSKAAKEGEEFSANNIERGRVIFVPGKALRNALKDLRYSSLQTAEVVQATPVEPNEPTDPDNNEGEGGEGGSGGL